MKRLAFISTNKSEWGGSEYLWFKTAIKFSEEGFEVAVSIPRWRKIPDEIRKLKEKNIDLYYNTDTSDFKKLINRFSPKSLQLEYKDDGYKFLLKFNPDLVIINQGGNTGGIELMEYCLKNALKFVTISQAANEAKWPTDDLNKRLSKVFPSAVKNYFVSNANKNLTELEIGQSIENSKIIFNPFNVDYENDNTYPEVKDNYLLANVARHEIFAKGQDILFQVLNLSKWKERNLIVNLYGKGDHTHSLNKIKNFYNLNNVNIAGYLNPEDIWKQNHALILTSRYEGLPLALVEAMLCGRTAIVTNVSGNAEVIIDNENGFLAKAATAEFVDEALERAWERRSEWKEIGNKAKEYIRSIIPEDPVKYFYDEIKTLKL